MRHLISATLMFTLKILSQIFFRVRVRWLNEPADKWQNVRLFVLLNHTSLFEPLFAGAIPFRVLYRASVRLVGPGADKTLKRPIAGLFFKLIFPNMVSITRKRDHTWAEFLTKIEPDSLIAIIPEGRMKRLNGLDAEGHPMSVKGGIADVLEGLDSGNMVILYSGGLHHVQAPGDPYPHLFRTIRANFEQLPIAEYKRSLPPGDFKAVVIADLERRQKLNSPPPEERRR